MCAWSRPFEVKRSHPIEFNRVWIRLKVRHVLKYVTVPGPKTIWASPATLSWSRRCGPLKFDSGKYTIGPKILVKKKHSEGSTDINIYKTSCSALAIKPNFLHYPKWTFFIDSLSLQDWLAGATSKAW